MESKQSVMYAFVAGAKGGLGAPTVRVLVKNGYTVVAAVRPGAAAETTDLFADIAQFVHVVEVDFLQHDLSFGVLTELGKKYGSFGAAVFCATDQLLRKDISSVSSAEFQNAFSVTVFGAHVFFSALLPFVERGGQMIGITTNAIEPNVSAGAFGGYVPAKYALRGMLREFARTASKKGVCVNAVAPGFMRTPLQSAMPDRMDDFIKEKNPFHDVLTPERVADMIGILCSGKLVNVTGQSFTMGIGDVETL